MKIGAAATVAAFAIGESACTRTPQVPLNRGGVFTADEFALVDELSEMIIPTDAHSPGAKAAKVAAYIDARLGEAAEEADKTTWRDGLARLMKLAPGQRLGALTEMARNERDPKTPDELFFVEMKGRVVQAHYSSEIGIKQEMGYKGNSFLQEFVGEDVS